MACLRIYVKLGIIANHSTNLNIQKGFTLYYPRPRFVSEDPIGIDGGVNLYGHVGNAPSFKNDESGMGSISDLLNHLLHAIDKHDCASTLIIINDARLRCNSENPSGDCEKRHRVY